MNRRLACLPKSPLNSRKFLRRALLRGPVAVALPLLVLNPAAKATNTEYDVVNGKSDLTSAATYSTGGTAGTGAGGTTPAPGAPTVTSDVTFDSGTAYSPAAFTLNSSQTFGSLNDLSTTALTIANTSTTGTGDTLTLGGSGDPGSSVPGASAGDLLFVATGGSLTINTGAAGSATALGLVLGQSGNFDIAGTATVGSIISDGSPSNGYSITKTGSGNLSFSAANTFSGGLVIDAGGVYATGASAAFGTGNITLGLSGSATAVVLAPYGETIANQITVEPGSGTREIITANGNNIGVGAITLIGGATNPTITLESGGGSIAVGSTMVNGVATSVTGTGNVLIASSATSRGGGFTFAGSVNNTGTITNTNIGSGTATLNSVGANVTGVIQNSGTSQTTLIGTSSYTSGTTVTLGTLDFQTATSLPTSGTTTVSNNGVLLLGVGGTTGFSSANVDSLLNGTLAGVSLGTGSVVGVDTAPGNFAYASSITTGRTVEKQGANALTLTGNSTFYGGLDVTNGTAQLGATGGTTGSLGNTPILGVAIGSSGATGTFVISRTNTVTQGTDFGVIDGAVGLTLNGGGTTILNQANAFTGTTTITGGSTLDLQNSLAIGSSILANGGTGVVFDQSVASHAFSIGGLNSGNNLALTDNGGNAVTLTLGGGTQTAATATYTGVLSGGGSLIKSGNNTQVLEGLNTYTGSTTINEGTLNLAFVAGTGGTANIIPATSALIMGGAPANTFAETNSAFPSGGTLTVTGNGTATDSQTFASVTLNPGYSTIGTSVTTGGTVNLALNTITHNLGGLINFAPSASGTTNITTTSTNDPNGGGIIGGFATYNKAGYAAITGGAVGLYTGSTVVPAGVITSSGTTNYQTTTGGAYTLGSATTSLNTFSTTSTTATSVAITTGQTLNFGINGGLLLTSAASGAVTLGATANTGTITAGGPTMNTAGELTIESFNGAVTVNSVIANNGSGATTLTWSNTGSAQNTLTLNAQNTYSGGTYIDAGRVSLGAASTAGSTAGTTASGPLGTGTVYILPGADLNLSAHNLTNNLVIAGFGNSESTGAGNYAGAFRFGGGETVSGTVTLAGDSGTVLQGSSGTISGNIIGSSNFNVDTTNGSAGSILTLSGINSNLTGNLSLNGPVAGVTINPVSPITVKFGSTTAGVGGNVVLNGTNPTYTSTTLDLNGFTNSVGALISIGNNASRTTVTDSGASATLTIGANNGSGVFGGNITDGGTGKALSIVQAGTGVQVFTGPNTYNGTTSVNAGTLLYNGSLTPTVAGGSAITVGSTTTPTIPATLGGTGILTVTSVAVNGNGTLAPGATVGATAGALTLNTISGVTINGNLAIALGSTGSNGTFVTTTGGLSVNGATLTLSGMTPTNGTVYDLVNFTGTLTETGSNEGFSTINGPVGYSYSVVEGSTFAGSDLELDVTAVPEPSTAWAGVLMLAGAGVYYRRQKNSGRC